ncbi:MAG: hypothetical protein J6K58_03495 [Lachnospiraceae bacterium]|nr:hypothetical protein [Lachnospiraceae bacterium]
MTEFKNIFSESVEIPEIVVKKADDAFAKIKMEGTDVMKDTTGSENMKNNKKRRLFKNQAAAIAGICLFAAGSITAVAAVRHVWSRGMQGNLQATDEQQQVLTEQGVATVYSEEDYGNLAVTDGNVTVTPDTVIVADQIAYLSFAVKGYELEEGAEPCFEYVDVYLGDDPDSEDGWLNMSASFYDGVVSDENGLAVYDDGTMLQSDENGRIISHYTDEEGTLQFVITAMVSDYDQSLLGKTIHVNFENLGTVYKAEYTGVMEGTWDLALDLSDVSATTNISVSQKIEDTPMTLDSIDISPVSIKINYSVEGEVKSENDNNGVPVFCGVVLKDGTRLPFMSNGGMSATDETGSKAYVISAFDRVIDVEQVASILVGTLSEADIDMIEIPITR